MSEEKEIKTTTALSEPTVTLVEDPFGIRTLEISDAQKNEDELISEESSSELDELLEDLGEDLEMVSSEESAQQLDSLARAMEEVAKQDALDSEAQLVHNAEEAVQLAEQLAREIAEDQAIADELARELRAVEGESADGASEEQVDPELQAALPQTLDLEEMQSCIETLLFMTDKPMSLTKLQELLGPELPHSLFQEAITALRDNYASVRHGIEIVEVAGGLQFRTKPGRAALAKKLAKVQTQRLSAGAMESLAIIAYKQPAMKEDIDKIRGVDSSYFVRQLLDKKLIHISGRSELPGRPMVYSTTDDFLQLFGLKDLSSLPSLRELEQMIPASQSGRPDDEDPRIREMRRLVDQMNHDASGNLNYDPREDETILKDIRERVNAIPTSTPYLEEQKALEKQAQEALKAQKNAANEEQPALPVQPELLAQTESFETAPSV